MKLSPDKKTLTLEINEGIDWIVQAGLNVPRRASMLMAYGLNSSNQVGEVNHHLPGFIQMVDAPAELTRPQQRQLKTDYQNWVVGSGFRLLIEGLEIFLNDMYHLIARTDFVFQGKDPEKALRPISKFENKSVSDKLNFLNRQFYFDTKMGKYYESLTKARNCLTHRGGVVGDKDISDKGHLEITWLGFDLTLVDGDGKEQNITLDTVGPIHTAELKEGAQFETAFVNRTLVFKKGDMIHVSSRQLQEICSMTSYTCAKLHQLVMNWLQNNGVNLNNGEPFKEPKVELYLEEVLPNEYVA